MYFYLASVGTSHDDSGSFSASDAYTLLKGATGASGSLDPLEGTEIKLVPR